MSLTMTLQHSWVKHTVTSVSAVPDPENDNEVFVIEDPLDVASAEDKAVYGCDVCGIPMEGNTDTTCDPVCHCGVNESEHDAFTDPPHSFVAMR